MKLLQYCMLATCCALLTGTAAGYAIAFTAEPAETMPGGVVTISGTSNIPSGYTDEAILYREVPNYLPKEAGRYSFTTAEDGTWGFTIDTTGFQPAMYKIQLSKSAEYPYGSSAVLMQTFTVTAPPETVVSATPDTTSLPSPVATPVTTVTPTDSPTPTTSPAGAMTAIAAAGISALGCVYALRRQNE
ncbi:hypothetical protein [Methanogenium organophilum]|uniref:Uncharacterized protein n=1 Tax=Methanogenium organophilum TaxID=2199 RepID=A0A9X9T8H1_METOG|nr:hypothetical protein [Methanogenium organophilum]WAI02453.1 hypothetical protein OU421_06155 [Methanogenium organophilum]